MTYKKGQGHVARLVAFWALFGLVAYGILGSLVYELRAFSGLTSVWVANLPLIGDLDTARVITLVLLVVVGLALRNFLNRPKSADLLIDTEGEMRKVTWPNATETRNGTIAVVFTVILMLAYLFGANALLSYILPKAMGGG